MADNDNKVDSNKKNSPFEFSSVFTKNQDKGAPANAEAPVVVDDEKQAASRSKQQRPASWSNTENNFEPNAQNQMTSSSVTEDNKLSIQDEQSKDLTGDDSESENKNGTTQPDNNSQVKMQEAAAVESIIDDETDDTQEPRLCTEIKFNLPASSFSLVSFFPDSHYAVVLKSGHYYAANLGTEVIEPTPYLNFETLVVSDALVVLAVTELNYSQSLLFLTDRFDGKKFRKPSESKLEKLIEECIEDNSHQFSIGGQTFSLLSKATYKEVDVRTGYFAYPSGTFIYNTNGYLVFEETNGTELLLADAHGCYVGFYLPLLHEVEEIKILLGPDVFIEPRRLTQTLMVVTNEETKQQSLLTCSRPMLVELSDLGIKDASQIEVSNGVAMITQEIKGSTCINVFTPKHQRIIIERGIKIDTLAIGNGVYLPTEGVMLLDDGRLIFAREEEDGSVIIRGKRVGLPQQYLEIS